MAKIKTIEDLRDHALELLEQLSRGEIDTSQAGIGGKLCETAIASVKSQMEYARMLGHEPNIPFMHKSHQGKLIEGDRQKQLIEPVKKLK